MAENDDGKTDWEDIFRLVVFLPITLFFLSPFFVLIGILLYFCFTTRLFPLGILLVLSIYFYIFGKGDDKKK